jgi:hypothetical protein
MALTFTAVANPYSIGDRWRSIYKIAADNSYPTGGWSMKPTDIGFGNSAQYDPELEIDMNNGAGFGLAYDYTNLKLQVYSHLKILTATFDPASLSATTSRDDAITFTGTLATDQVIAVIPPAAVLASVVVQNARVTGADTITARLTNPSAGAVDVASGTWTAILTGAAGTPKEVVNGTDLSGVLTAVRVRCTSKYRA